MKKLHSGFFITASMTFTLLLVDCTGGTSLKTQDIQDTGNITGFYTLILYRGAESMGNLKSMAFLDVEGDAYTLVPYAPNYEYTITPHLSWEKAFQIALEFIKSNRLFMNYQIRTILGPTGETIGYEVKPLYDSLALGYSDILTASYRVKEGRTVLITIEFLEKVTNQITDEY